MYNKKATFTILFCLLIFFFHSDAQINHDQLKADNTITVGKNKIKLGTSRSIELLGKTIYSSPNPEYLNGVKIYQSGEKEVIQKPHFLSSKKPFPSYLFKKLQPEFNKLENGTYAFAIEDVVIDKKGNLIYFDYSTPRKLSANYMEVHSTADFNNIQGNNKKVTDASIVPEERIQDITKKLAEVMSSNLKFSPALSTNGNPINCNLTSLEYRFDGFIEVKNHIASYRPLTSGKASSIDIEDQLQMPQY